MSTGVLANTLGGLPGHRRRGKFLGLALLGPPIGTLKLFTNLHQ